MQRRIFIRHSSIALTALLLFKDKSFAQLLDEYKVRMLTKEIGIFTEKGGAILFYVSKDGIVVVDSQFPESAAHLISELNKKGKQFRLLINTHHHRDHTSGNIAFKDLVPHVLAHENSRINQEKNAVLNKTEDKQLYPDQTFGNMWCEKIGGEEICLHYFGPAHTNGDSVVHFHKARIVHLGDLVFNRRHPNIDKVNGADIGNWIKVLDKITSTFHKKTRYVCGHAENGYDVIAHTADIHAFRDYLRNLLLFTSSQISAGKTRDEILKATGIPGSPEWKGTGIEKPLAAAYNELTAKLD